MQDATGSELGHSGFGGEDLRSRPTQVRGLSGGESLFDRACNNRQIGKRLRSKIDSLERIGGAMMEMEPYELAQRALTDLKEG